jgi:hypothetical protein
MKMMTEAAMRSEGGKVADWIECYANVPEGMNLANPVVLREFQRNELYRIYNNDDRVAVTPAVEAKVDAAALEDGDEAALELAMKVARDSSVQRAQQLDRMLAERPRLTVAMFAAYTCQMASCRIKEWEVPPCHVNNPSTVRKEEQDAAKMLRRMRRHGVSQFHPFPEDAIDAARSEVPRVTQLAVILYKMSRRGVDVADELHRALGLELGPARVNILNMTMDDDPPAGMTDDEVRYWKLVQRLLGQLISAS